MTHLKQINHWAAYSKVLNPFSFLQPNCNCLTCHHHKLFSRIVLMVSLLNCLHSIQSSFCGNRMDPLAKRQSNIFLLKYFNIFKISKYPVILYLNSSLSSMVSKAVTRSTHLIPHMPVAHQKSRIIGTTVVLLSTPTF